MNKGYVRARTLYVGGNLNNASTSGLLTWNSNNASSNANWNIVGRSNLYCVLKTVRSYVSLALAKTHDYLLRCAGRLCRTLKEDISLFEIMGTLPKIQNKALLCAEQTK